MTWLLTATGREHHLGACSALRPGNTPQIEEIAHALAQINRYTGHAARPYSVAEHSLLVCDLVQAAGFDCHAQMAALLHDAHEAFCGDAATPVKQVLGVAWMAESLGESVPVVLKDTASIKEVTPNLSVIDISAS